MLAVSGSVFRAKDIGDAATSTQEFILGDIVCLDQNNFSSERANQSRAA